ncbi:MAG: hypothetical protein IT379_11510, partial [Deltaproteobacteria bacterium]|nr:hypothetical protein [Deltaproteobacteria bacterium]
GEAIGVRFPESPRLELARSDPEVMQRMVLASFAQVFRGAGRVGPVVLVLEDAHWIDRESISLVEQLVAQARSGARELRLPLLALVVGRHESPHDVFDILREIAASRIALRPLSRSDSMALVGGLLGSRATDALLERIVARGGGNPLFLEELALDFLARGAHDLGEDSAVPIRMELAIQQRLDRLPPEAKNATKAASVFGDVFWADSLAALGVPATNELLPMLSTRHIVSRRGTSQHDATTEWEFRHSVMREVAYSMIADAEKRSLHLRAAAWYAAHGGGDPATLARHYELAGASEDAGRCHAQAAERRLATDDAQRALSHLDKALAAPSLVADRVRWVLLREEALHRLGDRARQRSDLDALESLISDEDLGRERARILRRRGRFAYSVGSFDEARAKLRSATTALDMVGEREESVAALLHLVRIELLACRVEDAGRMADEIKARVRGRTSPTAVATSEHAEGLVAAARGDLERGHLAIGRALTTLAQAQVGRAREVEVRLDGAVIAARLGLTGAANDGLARVRHDAEELGDVATRGWATVHMAALALERRDVATAIELLGDATGVGLTVDDPRLIAVARRLTAVALLDRSGAGDLEAAARAADAAVVGERATGMRPRIAPALSVRARVRLRLGDLRGAAGDVVEMLETRASDGWPEEHEAELRWTEVVVRRAHGDHRSAEDVAKRAQSWLLERATSIVDPGLRRAFLEGHSLHHVILVPDATR